MQADESLSDDELMRLARTEPEAAFRVLVRRHQHQLAIFARLLFPPLKDEICDVIVDVFLELFRNVGRYQPAAGAASGFKAYACRITKHRCIDRMRARARRGIELSAEEAGEAEASLCVAANDPWIATSDLRKAIDALPPEQRMALWDHYFLGKTRIEIAREQDETEGTIANRLRAGLAKLKAYFGGMS